MTKAPDDQEAGRAPYPTIYFDWYRECWFDLKDAAFNVYMSPNISGDCNLEFYTQKEFWDWYFSGTKPKKHNKN